MALRLIALLCVLATAAGFSLAPAGGIAVRRSAVAQSTLTMAHHVQKKSTKKHNDRRPKKRSLADRNRAPPSFNPTPLSAVAATPDFTVTSK
jgi:hypothetical protein